MMREALRRRAAAGAALALALALGGAVAVVTTTPAADAAPADLLPPASGILPGPAAGGDTPGSWGPCVPDPDATDSCQGWLIPPGSIVGSFPGTDDGPSVIVGGDFTAGLGSAETEGLLVVNGDALFDKSYNVGVAGGGTGVVPAHRADMLIVGGDGTVVNPSLDPQAGGNPATVGIGLTTGDGTSRFGDIHVGGTWNFRDPSYSEASNPGFGRLGDIDSANQSPPAVDQQNVIDSDTSVLADDHYTDLFGSAGKMARYSQQCYAELSTDTSATSIRNEGGTLALEHGTVTTGTEGGATAYTLTSTGAGDVVEFQLPATVGTAAQDAHFHIDGVKAGATVLINTLATGAVSQFVGDVYWGSGETDDLKALALEHGNAILWNYPFSTDVTLGGATQFPGSVLVGDPASHLTVGFSGSNGRIYTPGDLTHSGAAAGTNGDELHAYPFTGALGCAAPTPGTFTVRKALSGDGADRVPDGTAFTVHWTVTGPSDSPDLGREGDLEVLADGTPVTGPSDLQEGDVVTLSEPTLPDVDGVDWGTPTLAPNPVTIGAEDTVQAVTVTNEATLQRGGFTIEKAVTGDTGASTTSFDVAWSCDAPNADGDDSGTVTVGDGESEVVTGFPVGTTCTVAETTPADDNGTWAAPVVDPGTVTIAQDDGTAQVVTVTNTFTHAVGGFTIEKEVAGDHGASTTTFTGTWTCDAPDAAGDSAGTWSLHDGGTLAVDGFPTGTTCSVAEDAPTDDNGTWESSIAPAGDFVITEGTSAARVVTVTNTFTSTVGGFLVEKVVEGDGGASVDEFTVDWSCDRPNADGRSSGTVTLHAGDESDPITGFPVGTECTISEPTVDDPAGTWTASVSPAEVTIGSADPAQTALVTVTNTFDASTPTPTPSPTTTTPAPTTSAPTSPASSTPAVPAPTASATSGGGLAVTGFDALTIAAVGGFLVALGLAAVLIARRRRS
ncbi:DUF5979 domain-containing protein [Luteimicrobium sp. DT211]|uniref:DUF5979 domain-containing protein n=1 Tax=Luteimicrobium sp. DT211 TaxID=3393412 RepID=UPI003CF0B59B